MADTDLEFVEEDDASLDPAETATFSEAVLYSSDWTVETVISQLDRGNIELNPRFQRRDAWSPKGKSRFIESVILGLPIPQIVLAEKKGQRGQFIVLDGKQRLLALLQFTGKAEGSNNAFSLSGMEARGDLNRKKFSHIEKDPARRDDLNAFLNHTIRTVVIRNWPNTNFLHLVFLRLNTGSVKLSPQELRQAMVPGDFSDFIDDAAIASKEVQALLSRTTPDPRMRDVELLVRYLSFRHFLPNYTGRMKDFLDDSCVTLNEKWKDVEGVINDDVQSFKIAVVDLIDIFGREFIARKIGSRSFNRAVFDALIFYAVERDIREKMVENKHGVVSTYNEILEDQNFADAIESDTAGIPHTHARLSLWGKALQAITGLSFPTPELIKNDEGAYRISFPGFS